MDEKALWVRCKEKGDSAARDELIVYHMKVVKFVAGRMAIHVPPSIDMDDLIGWGVLGLIDAVEKFDHRQDVRFGTYASIRVRGAILDQIRSLDWAPRSLRALARKIGAAREKLRQQDGVEPTPEAIAAELGMPLEQVEDAVAQVQTAQVLSLDDYLPSEDTSRSHRLSTTRDNGTPGPEEAAIEKERQDRIVEAILKLPEQQQKVLNLYYYEELTLKEIGLVLEVSESRVCQVHGAAMKALRAGGSQKMRTTNRIGITDSVSRPSRKSSDSRTKTMPNSSTMSPTDITEVSRNSCIELTSPWRRDISRPTSVLSIQPKETRCSRSIMARRMSNKTFSATLPTTPSCT